MPTVVKTIGSAGGRDYSTLAAWAASLPANLVTDGNSYQGNCYNDSEFSGSSNLLTLSGHTTDASHTITLTTGAGQSFRDNANVQTNALRYNSANGVAIRSTVTYAATISVTDTNVFIENLQVANSGTHGAVLWAQGVTIRIDNCILAVTNTANSAGYMFKGSAGMTVTNSLLYSVGSPAYLVGGSVDSGVGGPSMYFCTIVSPSDAATPPADAVRSFYATAIWENCAVFGCAAINTGGTTFTFTNCMTDVASPPSGCTGGKAYANQFQNTTLANGDWREKPGADLQGAGTADAANGATDIAATARPQSGKWDIGCWELLSSGAVLTIDLALPIELLTMQRATPPGRLELVASQQADGVAALETLTMQRAEAPDDLEFVANRLTDAAVVLEVLLTRRVDPGTAMESGAFLRGDIGLPVEPGGGVASDAAGRAEWLAQVLAEPRVVSEWLVLSSRHMAAPGESAAAVIRDAGAPAQWLGVMATLLSEDALLSLEWTRLPGWVRLSLGRLLASPGKRRLLATPGRRRLLERP